MIKTLIQLKKLNDSYLPGKIKSSPVEKKRNKKRRVIYESVAT